MAAEKKEKKSETEKISLEEFKSRVIELAENGMTSEKIGEFLRPQGINPKEYGKI